MEYSEIHRLSFQPFDTLFFNFFLQQSSRATCHFIQKENSTRGQETSHKPTQPFGHILPRKFHFDKYYFKQTNLYFVSSNIPYFSAKRKHTRSTIFFLFFLINHGLGILAGSSTYLCLLWNKIGGVFFILKQYCRFVFLPEQELLHENKRSSVGRVPSWGNTQSPTQVWTSGQLGFITLLPKRNSKPRNSFQLPPWLRKKDC